MSDKTTILNDLKKFCKSSEATGDTNFPKEVCDILNKYFKDQMSHSVKNPIEGEVWKNKDRSSFP